MYILHDSTSLATDLPTSTLAVFVPNYQPIQNCTSLPTTRVKNRLRKQVLTAVLGLGTKPQHDIRKTFATHLPLLPLHSHPSRNETNRNAATFSINFLFFLPIICTMCIMSRHVSDFLSTETPYVFRFKLALTITLGLSFVG